MQFVWSLDGCQVLGEGQDGLLKTNLLGNKGEDGGYQNGGNVEVVFRNSSPKHVMSQKFGNTLYHSMFRQKAFISHLRCLFGEIWGDTSASYVTILATKC